MLSGVVETPLQRMKERLFVVKVLKSVGIPERCKWHLFDMRIDF